MFALLLLAAAIPLVSFFNKLARTRPAFVDIDPMVGMMVGRTESARSDHLGPLRK